MVRGRHGNTLNQTGAETMANGFSNEQMIQMVLEGQGKIQEQLVAITEKVDCVMYKGCAHRSDDIRRIEELEGWRTKGIIGIISLFVGLIVAFFKRG
jgi:hypothetical protein